LNAVAQGFEPMDKATLETGAVMLVEVGAAEIVIEIGPGQQPIGDDEDGMANSDNRLLFPRRATRRRY
jgi:hypothetical protein